VRVISVSQVHGRTRCRNPGDSVFLTQENGNGKKSITVDQLRQWRLGGSMQEKADDEVLNQENLGEGFFFAHFHQQPFEYFRSSQNPNEGLKSCHDLSRMNLSASIWRRKKRVEWKGTLLKLGEFL